MPAATARQAAPVARKEPVPGRWCFSPGLTSLTSSLTAVLAQDAICARAGLHVGCCGRAPFCIPCILHFFASCIPATAAFQNVNDKSVFSFHAVCIPCSLHHIHTAFLHYAFHSCVPEGQNYILHSMYPTRHSTKAAFRIWARSLSLLDVQELCIVAAHRRCQAAVLSDVRICSCARVTDLVCPVARVEANG